MPLARGEGVADAAAVQEEEEEFGTAALQMSDLQLLLTRLHGGKTDRKTADIFLRFLNVGCQFGLLSRDSLRANQFKRDEEQRPGLQAAIWLGLLLPPVFLFLPSPLLRLHLLHALRH